MILPQDIEVGVAGLSNEPSEGKLVRYKTDVDGKKQVNSAQKSQDSQQETHRLNSERSVAVLPIQIE